MTAQREALVLGLGRSGEAAARLLRMEGYAVVAVDRKATPDLSQSAAVLQQHGVSVRLGAAELPAGHFDLCVVSPGIAATAPWVADLERRGVPVIAELELGWRHCRARVLAVTGSNGKSTCVKLLAEALTSAGRRTAIAGNYGRALCDVVLAREEVDWIVLEVSSFQLEKVSGFRPDVGVLLNILPNHLDRHGDMETYMRMKARLFEKMEERDCGIVAESAAAAVREIAHGRHRWVTFGTSPRADYRFADAAVWRGSRELADLRGTYFDNAVLGAAAAAATAAIEACGCDAEHVSRAAGAFEALPHRMQRVAVRDGVEFVNDSKATNLAALIAALCMVRGKVRLIAGGMLKEEDLTPAKKLLANKVEAAYLIGRDMAVLASEWCDVVACRECGTLEQAVHAAWKDARSGETILLSPACASFDQFANFEQRGSAFTLLTQTLPGGSHHEK